MSDVEDKIKASYFEHRFPGRLETARKLSSIEAMLTFLLDHSYNVPKDWRKQIEGKGSRHQID